VKTLDDRIRHARVETVVNQNEITASVGKGASFSAERVSSTATRGTIFEEV
jgi:hypothetical protein